MWGTHMRRRDFLSLVSSAALACPSFAQAQPTGKTRRIGVDPQAWLADVLARIAEHPAHKLDELLPWNWRAAREAATQAA